MLMCGASALHSVDDYPEKVSAALRCGSDPCTGTPALQTAWIRSCGTAHLLLAGRYAGNVQLAAQSGGLFKQGHVMAAQRCHTGCFQTGRAAAEDGNLLFLRAAGWMLRVFS